MADFSEIKQEIDDKIVPFNNAKLITGKKLNDTLKDIVDAVDVAKVDKVSGKGLSSNDFTNTDKAKVEASIGDAPSDGNQYARENGQWVVVQRGGGSVDIIDDLTSERADAALSAKQGKVLKGLVDGAALGVVSLDGRMTSAERDIDLLEAAVAGKQDTLVAGDGISIAADGKTISSPREVFVAEYGETTYDEIVAAYNAGKVCVVIGTISSYTGIYVLAAINSSSIRFTSSYSDYLYFITCNSSNVWSNSNLRFEFATNKVTSLSPASTDTMFPSAKAVYDALLGKMANTPSGDTLHYSYLDMGATYDATSGYWTMGMLTDLTNEDMRRIYPYFGSAIQFSFNGGYYFRTAKANVRSTPKLSNSSSVVFSYAFRDNTNIEQILFEGVFSLSNIAYCFDGCSKLSYIGGTISLTNISTPSAVSEAFRGCTALRTVNMFYLKVSISLGDSPLLDALSIHRLITNASNTSAITITLHPTAKANWMASEYYEADSQIIIDKDITIA